MKEDEQENTRECVQKAMCIISTLPLFGQMASKLSMTMLAYFNQDSLKNKKIDTIEKVFDNINNQLTYLCMPDGAHSLTSDSQFFIIQNFSKIIIWNKLLSSVKGN